ncbi:MAG: Bax inhibitor-1/YccA family protein [Puniceicoccales bacterium]|jgi:uncharacterized YccA/Bax inhibitor family protein|nr:Bax inhibitor-1/YccA family protein [Puniceicoccales bacterium]
MFDDSSNPILSRKNFAVASTGDTATLADTINRCLILLALVFGSAVFAWINPGVSLSAIAGRLSLFTAVSVVALIVICIKKEWSGVMAPLYAICQGLTLGAFSRLFEMAYPGIVLQAVMLTLGVAFGMLVLYKTGVIGVSDRFRIVVTSALFGIFAVYLMSWVVSLFGVSVNFINSSGIFGLVFSAFVVVIAALSLAMDFDFIVGVSNRGLPMHMAWFAAFGLMVGLIYLYVHILSLLSKLRNR